MERYIQGVKAWYARYERHVSSVSLIGGFVFDAFTLKRVDLFLENFWVVVHLLMAGVGIIFLNLYEAGTLRSKVPGRAHFWLTIAIQFAFGGLLSVFLVFYFRSTTLLASWPFFLILVAVFACNELLKKHYTRLIFQISIFYLSIFLFAIYLIPVLIHQIGPEAFLLSGLASLVALALFLSLLRFLTRERFRKSRNALFLAIAAIFFLMNVLYFTNIIPPIPLSLKDSGVYHSIARTSDGNYAVEAEPGSWIDFFKPYRLFHETAATPVYVFSAIFSPTSFDTSILHEWQHYDETSKNWVTMATIPLPIVGGRDGGYRTYSALSNIAGGLWRVNVETERKQLIGRIKFEVVIVNEISTVSIDSK
jgi:hypothetical protein